jgi:hypothetical protein
MLFTTATLTTLIVLALQAKCNPPTIDSIPLEIRYDILTYVFPEYPQTALTSKEFCSVSGSYKRVQGKKYEAALNDYIKLNGEERRSVFETPSKENKFPLMRCLVDTGYRKGSWILARANLEKASDSTAILSSTRPKVRVFHILIAIV